MKKELVGYTSKPVMEFIPSRRWEEKGLVVYHPSIFNKRSAKNCFKVKITLEEVVWKEEE